MADQDKNNVFRYTTITGKYLLKFLMINNNYKKQKVDKSDLFCKMSAN